MDTITNWKARRAGGRITITGSNAKTGEVLRIVGVDVIEQRPSGVVAVKADGSEFNLSVMPPI